MPSSAWGFVDVDGDYGSALSVAGFIMAAPADFLNFIDVNKDRFIQRLASAVEIPRYYPPDHLA